MDKYGLNFKGLISLKKHGARMSLKVLRNGKIDNFTLEVRPVSLLMFLMFFWSIQKSVLNIAAM